MSHSLVEPENFFDGLWVERFLLTDKCFVFTFCAVRIIWDNVLKGAAWRD